MAPTSSHSHIRRPGLLWCSQRARPLLALGRSLLVRILYGAHRSCEDISAEGQTVVRDSDLKDAAPSRPHHDAIKSQRHVTAMIHGFAGPETEPAVPLEKIECL